MNEDRFCYELVMFWQELCLTRLGQHCNKLLFHVNNEGEKNKIRSTIDKAKGVKRGVADFILFWKGKAYPIELKIGKNKQSDAQIEFQMQVELQGIDYFVSNDLDEVKAYILGIINT